MSDSESALIAPLISPARRGGRHAARTYGALQVTRTREPSPGHP